MGNINFELAQKITRCIANIFFHVHGYTEHEFNNLCCDYLREILHCDSVCLDVIAESEQPILPCIPNSSTEIVHSCLVSGNVYIISIYKDKHKIEITPLDINVVEFISPHLIEAIEQNKQSNITSNKAFFYLNTQYHVARLTLSERKITELILRSMSNTDISIVLAISPKTLSNHLGKIYSKFKVNSKKELMNTIVEAAIKY